MPLLDIKERRFDLLLGEKKGRAREPELARGGCMDGTDAHMVSCSPVASLSALKRFPC